MARPILLTLGSLDFSQFLQAPSLPAHRRRFEHDYQPKGPFPPQSPAHASKLGGALQSRPTEPRSQRSDVIFPGADSNPTYLSISLILRLLARTPRGNVLTSERPVGVAPSLSGPDTWHKRPGTVISVLATCSFGLV